MAATGYDQDDIMATANHQLTSDLYNSDKLPSWATPQSVTVAVGNHTFLGLSERSVTDLVFLQDREAMTDNTIMAEYFDKAHKNVLPVVTVRRQ